MSKKQKDKVGLVNTGVIVVPSTLPAIHAHPSLFVTPGLAAKIHASIERANKKSN